MKRIKIIGAGPAGIFAALSLSQEGKYNIELIDMGNDLEKRRCYLDKRGSCANCSPCNIHQGFGGAGTMSDGKLNFDPRIGNNLDEIIFPEKNSRLTKEVEGIFIRYGAKIIENHEDKIGKLEKLALKNGIKFLGVEHAHIGSEKLTEMMAKVRDELKNKDVQITTNKEIKELNELACDVIVLAPGRSGAKYMEKILQDQDVRYTYRPIDLGVRIEVPRRLTDDITNVSRDMKFYITTDNNQKVRTFCACPGGFVDIEKYDSFKLVNGHAYAERQSENTNFALLTTVDLTEPISNTNKYARTIAQTFFTLSNRSGVISQRFGDLKRRVRSKNSPKEIYNFLTTLVNPVWGDIAMGMPSKHLDSLLKAIDKLNAVIPGIAGNNTIWHAPEIKFHGLKIQTDNFLRAKNNLYVAGDGSGYTRGIVGAAVSGLLVAEGIKKYIN